ncbi:nucleotidyltransferase domain-containing protein [Streptomyces sp. NBC_00825]|uniref:nucleotidyltransferase domain-containing protein n=1 Tax=unclassified Streptomyces TaxID=2593676 RepID=UPI00224D55C6|nr:MULTISPECIES: nucleotidyltransferase domain-containing protein [unclassified Streptomyces]WTB51961.1 nucleotidyltransferase domain-containing protein [Streptomyces sp. NBC_00826]WTH95148.1 nucleotidyltransferase domain-containing protein [Streptomyces sp. NBC_00825]WTI03882.1 nucleotidyltransferase domain-containing protein [Streptomyces sp. NBC_00822]MCX4869467.1 nucleotidyltransferase domain-containing protein [Streptomyces sp. NBC_00906]MCX4900706.1 nucleotidyltransferase domain-containi
MSDQAVAIAQASRLVGELFPQALGAVLGGSVAQGRATPASDLDIGVLLPSSAGSGREVIRYEGRLVELFLNDAGDVPRFFEWDRARRRATVVFVYAQGMTLTDPYGHVARTRQLAEEIVAMGPPLLTAEQWRQGRYVLTCYLDDLIDSPSANRHEQLVVADHVLREAAELVTAHHGAWTGIGKWLPRRLVAADPELGQALLNGHQTVAEQADPGPLAAAATKLLDLIGGPLRDGYSHRWQA